MKTSRNQVALVVALLFVFGFTTGCKRAANAFPPSGAVAGWDKSGDTRSFDPDTLWTYVDGGSDLYVNAGVTRTYTSYYKFNGTVGAVVDVFSMKSPTGAKQVFEANPVAESKPLDLGDAARLYDRSVIFRKGNNLVRVTAYQGGDHQADALVALAHGVESRL